MKRDIRIALITVFILTLLGIPLTVWGAVYHVGPGQTYNGTTQATINQAIKAAQAGDTVYLHAATYNITSPIFAKSGITLRGDGNSTVIHAAGDNVCNSETETGSAYILCNDVSNVTICYLRFTSTANDKNDGGHGDGRNCIEFRRASGCTVHHVTFTRWLWNDAVRIRGSSNMTVHNCQIDAAHDGISFFKTKGGRAYNNNISVQINNGIRTDGAENIEIDHNTFTSTPALGGWCCVQIQNAPKNINIHHNIFHDTAGKIGVAPYSFSGSNISVHDNIFWNCSEPIKVGSSSNNTINPSNKTVSYWVSRGYGSGATGSSSPPTTSTPTTTTPTNNTTQPPPSTGSTSTTTDPNAWYSATNYSAVRSLGSYNTGTVTIEFDLTPLGSRPAGVIGYADSSTSISSYSSMGMLIELGTNGCFRVRNGTTYAALRSVTFSPNKTYHFKIIANNTNAASKTYDVYVTPPGGSTTMIANDYLFRNQSMNDVGKIGLIQASGYGNFKINNHKISKGTTSTTTTPTTNAPTNNTTQPPANTGSTSTTTDPNAWYSATNYSAVRSLGSYNTGTVTIEFDLTPLGSRPAGVIGYADSSTSISSYSSMGMLIELGTNGCFRVRNGTTYAALRSVTFSPNKTYHFKIIANNTNAASKTYDVYVTPPGGSTTMIANDYLFRNQSMNDVGKIGLIQASGYGNFKISNHRITR